MTSLMCVRRPGGTVDVHDIDIVEELVIDGNDHIETLVGEIWVLRGGGIEGISFACMCQFLRNSRGMGILNKLNRIPIQIK